MIRLKLPCSLEYRDIALRVVEASCRLVRPRRSTDARLDGQDFDEQVVTSFGEAFTNVVLHGGNPAGAEVELEIETHPDRLTIRLMDHGKPFEVAAVPPPELDRLPASGLGLHIIRSWMDEVTYRSGAQRSPNVLSMTKRLGSFSRTDDGDDTVLRIEGVLDAVTVPNIRRTLDAIVTEQRKSITVDFSALRLIDSSGVGVIVSLYKRCKEFGGIVRVTGLKDQPLSIFRLLRLDRVFDLA